MRLIHFPEPTLLFRHNQSVEDPRDGLSLFGPLDKGSPYGIRAGVIGTKDGLRRFRDWAVKIQGAVIQPDPDELFQLSHPPYPGFEAAFAFRGTPSLYSKSRLSGKLLTRVCISRTSISGSTGRSICMRTRYSGR